MLYYGLISKEARKLITPKTLDQIAVGDRATYTRTFGEGEVALFVGVTADYNPYHTNETFAQRSRFGRRTVPGLLVITMFTHVGGAWAVLGKDVYARLLRPVFIGDTVTVEVEVVEKDEAKNEIQLRLNWWNHEGTKVAEGTSRVAPSPKELIEEWEY